MSGGHSDKINDHDNNIADKVAGHTNSMRWSDDAYSDNLVLEHQCYMCAALDMQMMAWQRITCLFCLPRMWMTRGSTSCCSCSDRTSSKRCGSTCTAAASDVDLFLYRLCLAFGSFCSHTKEKP